MSQTLKFKYFVYMTSKNTIVGHQRIPSVILDFKISSYMGIGRKSCLVGSIFSSVRSLAKAGQCSAKYLINCGLRVEHTETRQAGEHTSLDRSR